ncbi:lipocalin family protein [Sinomicrobium sp. M5D2P9]
MKTILSMFFVVSLALGCSEDTDINEVSVIGKWQMTRRYVSPGGDNVRWETVKDGGIYQFKADSTFTSNATDCQEGKFSVKGDSLQLDFNCNYEVEPQIMRFYFKGGDLVFSPLGPVFCIETCLYRYEKMD